MKKRLVFFDTETTGNTEKDYLCQIAYKTAADGGTAEYSAMFKPPVRIPPEASAVHHISNKMVADRPAFRQSPDYGKVKGLFEAEDTVVVAHNAAFDLAILRHESIAPRQFICTLRVARHLDREEKLDRYNLQYLRYLLEFDVDAAAHDAMGDVLVLELLFDRLLKQVMKEDGSSEAEAVEKMIEISSHPSILRRINFGKHKGKRVEDVAAEDRSYLEWLLGEKEKDSTLDEDWIYTLRHHLGK